MAIGLVGRKRGMTRIFTDAGETVPVTVVEVLPNRVTQVKSAETDGYRSVQVAFGSIIFQGRAHLRTGGIDRGLDQLRLGGGESRVGTWRGLGDKRRYGRIGGRAFGMR